MNAEAMNDLQMSSLCLHEGEEFSPSFLSLVHWLDSLGKVWVKREKKRQTEHFNKIMQNWNQGISDSLR